MVNATRSAGVFFSLIYLMSAFASIYLGDLVLRSLCAVIGSTIFMLVLFSSSVEKKAPYWILIFFLMFMFVMSFLNIQETEWRSFFTFWIMLGCLGVAWFSIEFRFFSLINASFGLMLLLTGLLFLYFRYGPKEFNGFLEGSSRNVYSGILIATLCGYVMSCIFEKKQYSTVLCLVVLILSFPLYSRNGLAVALAIFLGCSVFKFPKSSVLFFFIASIGVVLNWDFLLGLIMENTNLSAGLQSERSDIFADYISHVDPVTFFSGVNLYSVPKVVEFGGNPHSAILRLHSYFGFGVFAVIAVCLVSLILLFVDGFYIFFLLLVLYIYRAFFDIFYLFNIFDFYLFPLVFYWFFRPFIVSMGKSYGVDFPLYKEKAL
ncbi:hypothetical protein [Pseudomonas matsuisoli]|uniref:hypothetical protein n=1 Tax=Pseudomonas matsuisoli TaxID=1515666 RepID=UPI00166390B5|nr:hypothetical protein [Pseudomonas matsuisoli]